MQKEELALFMDILCKIEFRRNCPMIIHGWIREIKDGKSRIECTTDDLLILNNRNIKKVTKVK